MSTAAFTTETRFGQLSTAEVCITKHQLDSFHNEVLKGTYILNALRSAGIPALGALFPHGVAHGTLSCTFDDLGIEQYIWRWES